MVETNSFGFDCFARLNRVFEFISRLVFLMCFFWFCYASVITAISLSLKFGHFWIMIRVLKTCFAILSVLCSNIFLYFSAVTTIA